MLARIVLAATLALLTPVVLFADPQQDHQQDSGTPGASTGFRAKETPGGYEPADAPIYEPANTVKMVFVAQPLTPDEAYPAPAPRAYPPCSRTRADECVERR